MKPVKWYHQPWFVLLMLTPLALGPFALPLLWKSPRFSGRVKMLLTLLTAAWSIWFVIYVVQHVIPALRNEYQQLNTLFQY